MTIARRIIIVTVAFFLFATFPENLSRSALPYHTETLTPAEETQLYRFMMRDKIQQIDAIMNRYSWFNGNVMVVKDHKVLYKYSNGFADFQTREPLSTASVFELASVSKQFTAIAVLMLYERNLIDLEDKVQLIIPEFPYQNITIRQLLNHTSGLPNYMWVLENYWKSAHLPSNEEMIGMLVEHHPNPFFWPGRRYNYSNTGYAVLASVVERATGSSFTHFLRENIFDPLNMENTFTNVDLHETDYTISHLARGHHRIWRSYRRNTTAVHDKVLGDKGIYSNLDDIYKWDQALYNEQLVSNAVLEKAFQPLSLKNHRTFPYGFGFRIGNRNGEKYVYHHGLWEGFSTSFVRYIGKGDAIVVLNNTNQKVNNQIIRQVANVLDQITELNPTHNLAQTIVKDGYNSAEDLYVRLNTKALPVIIEESEISEIIDFLRELNKPGLASLVYDFYRHNCIKSDPAATVAYIE